MATCQFDWSLLRCSLAAVIQEAQLLLISSALVICQAQPHWATNMAYYDDSWTDPRMDKVYLSPISHLTSLARLNFS